MGDLSLYGRGGAVPVGRIALLCEGLHTLIMGLTMGDYVKFSIKKT